MIDNSLFYTCSLIEYIGREKKLRRGDTFLEENEKNQV